MKNRTVPFFLLFLPPFVGAVLWSGFFLTRPDPLDRILGALPVQSGGRVKPFESFAREALLSTAGKLSLARESATRVVWEWIAKPENWYSKSFLHGKVSPEFVMTDSRFQEALNQALERKRKKAVLTPAERKKTELYERARLFQAVAQGSVPGFIPHPTDPRAGWIPLEGLASPEARALLASQYPAAELQEVQESLRALVEALRGFTPSFSPPPAGGERGREGRERLAAARAFSLSLKKLRVSRTVRLDDPRMGVELLYNRLRPFWAACLFYLVSGILWFLLKERSRTLRLGFFLAGFVFHSLGFVLRCWVAGRPPVTNMYESILWVGWAAVAFSIVLTLLYRREGVAASAGWVASFTLLIGESFPAVLDPSLAPLVPVLRNNYWLTVHVLTITLSYGAFLLAWGLAHVNLFHFAFRPEKREEGEQLGEFLYRALQMGVVLLAAGTILGGVWANDSWGRFWGWDPKETWALIALFGYLVILHGRSAGWLGTFGTALGSVFAFLGVLMAWYGVNFVLAAGFHSYGFGGGGLSYVGAAVLLDLILVSALAIRYDKVKFGSLLPPLPLGKGEEGGGSRH